MRAKDTARLSTIRLLLAAIKQREVDERREQTDADVLAMHREDGQAAPRLDRAVRGRQADGPGGDRTGANSSSCRATSRSSCPTPRSTLLIAAAIAATGAAGPAGMGKVMAELKRKLAGRADMTAVSAQGEGEAHALSLGVTAARRRDVRHWPEICGLSPAQTLPIIGRIPRVLPAACFPRRPDHPAGHGTLRRQISNPMIPNDFIQTLLCPRRHRRGRSTATSR